MPTSILALSNQLPRDACAKSSPAESAHVITSCLLPRSHHLPFTIHHHHSIPPSPSCSLSPSPFPLPCPVPNPRDPPCPFPSPPTGHPRPPSLKLSSPRPAPAHQNGECLPTRPDACPAPRPLGGKGGGKVKHRRIELLLLAGWPVGWPGARTPADRGKPHWTVSRRIECPVEFDE
ncbi:hypothetical protein BDZ85DRAFT_137563 [Elsinoe ampelina]|uniref:Uncharacterized protein n=1 Tax=Elsinoe ampelina TaxID=302913 RepID=A0A6A6G956_9PEZI|nr:hypothetical protein BDZ85DRAFT_137563 [Elsinoe ampelina]